MDFVRAPPRPGPASHFGGLALPLRGKTARLFPPAPLILTKTAGLSLRKRTKLGICTIRDARKLSYKPVKGRVESPVVSRLDRWAPGWGFTTSLLFALGNRNNNKNGK